MKLSLSAVLLFGLAGWARAQPLSGSLEAEAAGAGAWADGNAGGTAPLAADAGALGQILRPSGLEKTGGYRHAPPRFHACEPPLPPNEAAPEIGFSAGFTLIESPALAVMQVPYVGEPIGYLIFGVLLVPALVAGGIGALIGLAVS